MRCNLADSCRCPEFVARGSDMHLANARGVYSVRESEAKPRAGLQKQGRSYSRPWSMLDRAWAAALANANMLSSR